ncbi:hypothetical protein ACW95P_04310 [Candidatus Mycoplasma pogonae]
MKKGDIDHDQKIDLIFQNQQEIKAKLKDYAQRLDSVEQKIGVLEIYHQNYQDK